MRYSKTNKKPIPNFFTVHDVELTTSGRYQTMLYCYYRELPKSLLSTLWSYSHGNMILIETKLFRKFQNYTPVHIHIMNVIYRNHHLRE